MPRDVDERKTRKALRKLRAAKMRAEAGTGPELSEWEEDFLNSLEARLEEFGSAFNDPEKGDREEPLSVLQAMKIKEIDKKTRGKGNSGFGRRSSFKSKPSPRKSDQSSRIEPPEMGTHDAAPTSKLLAQSPNLRIVAQAVGSDLMPEEPKNATRTPRPTLKVIEGDRD